MNDLASLDDALRDQLGRLQAERKRRSSADLHELFEKHIGKFYRYENRYSGEDPSWPIYRKITGFSGNYLYGWRFELTAHRIFEAKPDHFVSLNGWMEISEQEFLTAWTEFKIALKNLPSNHVPE